MNKYNVGGNLVDVNRSSKISDIPQNKTLYADQFTENVSDHLDRAVFSPNKIDDVFEHYQPSVTGVELASHDEMVYEDFHFNSIDDFEDDKLIEQSSFMQATRSRIDALNSAITNLQRNRDLKYILEDDEAKANLLEILKELKSELDD